MSHLNPRSDSDGVLDLSLHRRNDAAVLTVRGELDKLTVHQLLESVAAALRSSPRALVIDLTAVSFLCSTGISALLETQSAAGEGTTVAVVAVGATLRPLQLTGVTGILPVFSTVDAALAH